MADGQQVLRLQEGREPIMMLNATGPTAQQQVVKEQQVQGQQESVTRGSSTVQHGGGHPHPHHHQQHAGVGGTGSSWLPSSWRSLWQQQQQQEGSLSGQQQDGAADTRPKMEPTPA